MAAGIKLTTEEFIARAKEIYGDKYDYSKVEYVNASTKVCIICPIHGEFWQRPKNHLDGHGCNQCSSINAWDGRRISNDTFISKVKEIHGDKYDYSKVEYTKMHDKVCIICPTHGEFWQSPSNLLSGKGCPKCAGKKRTSSDFIAEAQKVHGDKYDYSKVEYINCETKIVLTCPTHGDFSINPSRLLSGCGCPKCASDKKWADKRLSTEEFIAEAQKVHGDKYDYSKVEYVNSVTKVCIICPIHGEFWQTPDVHLRGCGCPKCAGKNRTTEEVVSYIKEKYGNTYDCSKVEFVNMSTPITLICPTHGEFTVNPTSVYYNNGDYLCPNCQVRCTDTKGFIAEAQKVHGDKYDYSKVEYTKMHDKVCIICPTHGEFWQSPYIHLNGGGCRKCAWDSLSVTKARTTEEFIAEAQKVHGDKYDYSKVEYANSVTKVCIICPIHGEFWQTPDVHLRGCGCPICGNGYLRDYKLSLLESGDLLHMSSHQLIEVIANKKLPSEFKTLAYTHADSEARAGSVQDLIDLFKSDKTEEEIEEVIEEMEEKAENTLESSSEPTDNNEFSLVIGDDSEASEEPTNEDDDKAKEEDTKLPSIVLSDTQMYDDLLRMKPSDESAKFIVLEETHKLWNSVLKANEDGKLEDEIEKIRTMEGGEFMSFVRDTFMAEYEAVVAIEKDNDYSFPYEPSLMQKLMVYYMQNNKSFGNWCGTGAGKTNAFLFATRKTNSRVTVAIVPNDVIDTLVKSIKNIYPNSDVLVPQSVDELYTCNPNKFTYIIYNYEKFQGNNGAEATINRLFETNTIDFICLDEVQNVKVRDIDNASSRSQFIKDLIVRGREKNSEMKTLVMSATPCINNLYEVRSIIELLTGVEHAEIGNRNSISNIHNAYKALLINGFRYVPKYPIVIEERTIDIDCSNDENLYLGLTCKEKGDISGIEYTLAMRKMDSIKDELRKGTIVYATWVDGMAELLTKRIKSWGYSVESYNGESGDKEGRKEILDRFLNDKTDVLVCSKPISTGVDGLQKKCNKMIIVSLPWTDADYTQLKGRIYRQGSVFKKVEFVIPQVVINTPKGTEWSWDKMRKHAIDTKKSLGSAVVDGLIQESYTINKDKLLAKAMEALKDGLEDIEIERRKIESTVTYTEKEREYSESFINEIHREANTSSSKTTHEKFTKNREIAIEYHRQREISKTDWVEDPVDRVSEMINKMSSRYTRIIDLGCGMNKLKTVVGENRMVQGVDHINVSEDASVIEADMSNLTEVVADNSKDVAVFCLSLWGTNYKDYFTEAYRILDADGKVIVVEPSSKFGENERYGTTEEFIADVESYGFERIGRAETHNNFIYFKFTK